eukprot:m.76491 g.76491  ORF g.76491 m.76491 type:complete len:88 (-) comp8113_c1_seq1:225-488(-)
MLLFRPPRFLSLAVPHCEQHEDGARGPNQPFLSPFLSDIVSLKWPAFTVPNGLRSLATTLSIVANCHFVLLTLFFPPSPSSFTCVRV